MASGLQAVQRAYSVYRHDGFGREPARCCLASSEFSMRICRSPVSRYPARPYLRRTRRHQQCRVSAMFGGEDDELKEGLNTGTKVKVTKSVKVFHVPKNPELDLEGWEGTIVEIVRFFKGAELSANLPYKVQFQLEVDGKPKKFLAHLVEKRNVCHGVFRPHQSWKLFELDRSRESHWNAA